MMQCISFVRINGKPIDNIIPLRGLRQGDPLSPYLFLIYVEDLSALIKKSVQEGIFCKASLEECDSL